MVPHVGVDLHAEKRQSLGEREYNEKGKDDVQSILCGVARVIPTDAAHSTRGLANESTGKGKRNGMRRLLPGKGESSG